MPQACVPCSSPARICQRSERSTASEAAAPGWSSASRTMPRSILRQARQSFIWPQDPRISSPSMTMGQRSALSRSTPSRRAAFASGLIRGACIQCAPTSTPPCRPMFSVEGPASDSLPRPRHARRLSRFPRGKGLRPDPPAPLPRSRHQLRTCCAPAPRSRRSPVRRPQAAFSRSNCPAGRKR